MTPQELFNEETKSLIAPPNDKSTFIERVGLPDELSSVIGRISMNFSGLEETLNECITRILKQSNDIGQIITAELSFKNKVNLFSSLYLRLRHKLNFNEVPNFELEHFKEIIKALNRCENFRNDVIHSKFLFKNHKQNQKVIRVKITAKQKLGLKVINEETDVIKLFNIADYITYIAFALDEFCLINEE